MYFTSINNTHRRRNFMESQSAIFSGNEPLLDANNNVSQPLLGANNNGKDQGTEAKKENNSRGVPQATSYSAADGDTSPAHDQDKDLSAQHGQEKEHPCERLLKQALLVAAGLFIGQSIVHIMDMAHHQEAPNAADPIVFGGYALATYLVAWLLETQSVRCSESLPEQAIPVMRIIALTLFSYALISVGVDDWNDINSDPDTPTNTTNTSFGL